MTQREQLEALREWQATRIITTTTAISEGPRSLADRATTCRSELRVVLAEIDRLLSLAEPAPVEKHEPRPLTIEEEEQIYADSQGQHEDDEENPFR